MDAKIKLVNDLMKNMLEEKLNYLELRNKTEEQILIKCNQNKKSIISLISESKTLYLKIEEQEKQRREAREKSLKKSTSTNLLNRSGRGVSRNASVKKTDLNNTTTSIKGVSKTPTSRFDFLKSKSKPKLANNTSLNQSNYLTNTTLNSTSRITRNTDKSLNKSIKSVGKTLVKNNTSTNIGVKSSNNLNTSHNSRPLKNNISSNNISASGTNTNRSAFQDLKRSKTKPKKELSKEPSASKLCIAVIVA